MLFWSLLSLMGIAGTLCCFVGLCHGLMVRNFRQVVLGVLLPIMFWVAVYALAEADQRFIEREIQKNGGRLPSWVW